MFLPEPQTFPENPTNHPRKRFNCVRRWLVTMFPYPGIHTLVLPSWPCPRLCSCLLGDRRLRTRRQSRRSAVRAAKVRKYRRFRTKKTPIYDTCYFQIELYPSKKRLKWWKIRLAQAFRLFENVLPLISTRLKTPLCAHLKSRVYFLNVCCWLVIECLQLLYSIFCKHMTMWLFFVYAQARKTATRFETGMYFVYVWDYFC